MLAIVGLSARAFAAYVRYRTGSKGVSITAGILYVHWYLVTSWITASPRN